MFASNCMACLSRELLEAFIGGRVGAYDRRSVIAHIANCDHCREIALTASGTETFDTLILPQRRRWTRTPSVLLAAAALTAVLLLLPQRRMTISRTDMDAVVAAGALLQSRPSPGRLSADFPYRRTKPAVRGSDSEIGREPGVAGVWAVIARLQEEGDSASLERRHALGVAWLLVGKTKVSINTLQDALREETHERGEPVEAIRRSHDAALLNDLAASYLASGEDRSGRGTRWLALEAAQRAWSLQQTAPIAWTRAVVIESHHIRTASIAAWRDFLALEPRSEWSDLAAARLRDLQQPTDHELWPAARARLLASRNDDPEIFRTVDRFRQDVRLWCEDELLPQWADAVRNGNDVAGARLEKIGILGKALEAASGEREVTEAVEAIRNADASVRRRLAEGHAAYGASRSADRNFRVAESIRAMDAAVAALSPELTPFAWRALIEHAGMVYMSNDYGRALAELQRIPAADVRISNACQGLYHALIGIIDLQTGSYQEAADHDTRAVEAFRRAGERDYEATLLSRLAEALDYAGDSARAQSCRQRALQLLERTGDPKHIHDTLYGAALEAIGNEQQAEAALALDTLVAHDRATRSSVTTCTALMWRSAWRYHSDAPDAAAADLAEAERVCRSIDDASVRERALANLELAKSAFGSDASSAAPLTGLDDAIRYYQRTNSHVWLRTAYFARARRLAKRGDMADAESDFRAAIAEGDASRARIDERQARMTFTATADEIEDGYVDFLLQRHREIDAFELTDRRRVRELVDSPAARWRTANAGPYLPDIQAALPLDAALIEYRVVNSAVVAWVVTPDAFTTVTLPRTMGEIKPAIAGMESGAQEPAVRTSASYLYDALLRPLEPLLARSATLVIIPDDELERVAYSALYDNVGRRWTLETRTTLVAPSALLFAESRERWSERSSRDERVVVVEAATGGPDLAELPEATKEAQSIAAFYPRARVIDGASAAGGRSLLRGVDDASMLQFVGHTVVDGSAASRTLRLGDGPQSRLETADILTARLPRLRLVYLSACETDRGPILKSEGSITIARYFFAAGVPAVVGSLWPIDDAAARLAARTFHERLRAGATPAESLRQAQATLKFRGWPFREWANLRIIGAGV